MSLHEALPYHDEAYNAPLVELILPDTAPPTKLEIADFALAALKFIKEHATKSNPLVASKSDLPGVVDVNFIEGEDIVFHIEDAHSPGAITDPRDSINYDEEDDTGIGEYFEQSLTKDDGWDKPYDEDGYDQDHADGDAESREPGGSLEVTVNIFRALGNPTMSRLLLISLPLNEDQQETLLSLRNSLSNPEVAERTLSRLQNFNWAEPRIIDYGVRGVDDGNAHVPVSTENSFEVLDRELDLTSALIDAYNIVSDADPDLVEELARDAGFDDSLEVPVSGLTLVATTTALKSLTSI